MKQKLVIFAFALTLAGCSATEPTSNKTIYSKNSLIGELEEQSVPGSKKPEIKKVHIARPGISTGTLLNGVTDILVDGRLESDSLNKKNAVHVLIDDAVENTGEIDDVKTGH